jgi:hypothetical protein
LRRNRWCFFSRNWQGLLTPRAQGLERYKKYSVKAILVMVMVEMVSKINEKKRHSIYSQESRCQNKKERKSTSQLDVTSKGTFYVGWNYFPCV